MQSLKWTRDLTGSQCSCIMYGETWSRWHKSNTSRAAAFCTLCNGSSVDCGSPANTELQKSNRGVIKANTRWMVTCLPTRRRIRRSRRMWKKQTAAAFAICFFIVRQTDGQTYRKTNRHVAIAWSALCIASRGARYWTFWYMNYRSTSSYTWHTGVSNLKKQSGFFGPHDCVYS